MPRNQRSRKRGQRRKASGTRPSRPAPGAPPAPPAPPPEPGAGPGPGPGPGQSAEHAPESVGGWRVEPQMSRSQRRDAEVRAGLTPIAPGERPRAIVVSAVIAAIAGGGQLVGFLAGATVHGQTPTLTGTVPICVVLMACAVGLWRLWYGAVLGFMALLAIIVVVFAGLLIEASNLLAVVVAVVVIAAGGYLFFKLVRVLSRIQMPRYPGR